MDRRHSVPPYQKASNQSGSKEISSADPERNKRTYTYYVPLFVIVAVSFAVYFRALFNDFVYDDLEVVVENEWIRDARFIPDIFSTHEWGFLKDIGLTNYYRPMIYIIFMAAHAVFGPSAWGFHLVNILFHAGVSVLVFLITYLLISDRQNQISREDAGIPPYTPGWTGFFSIPFIAALLFATHPIHVEPVVWISSLMELSFSFFYLLSLYWYMKFRTGQRTFLFLLSLLAFSLALLSKEPAVTLPVVLVVYDLSLRKSGQSLVSYLKVVLPFMVVLGLYVGVRFAVLGAFAPVPSFNNLTLYETIINVFFLFSQYLQKLLFPITFSTFYVRNISSILSAQGIISLFLTASFAASAVFAWKRNRLAFFCMAIILVPLLPAIYVPNLSEVTLAERYAYLSSSGYVILIAMFLRWTIEKAPRFRSAVSILSVLLIGLYSSVTFIRIPVWKDNLTIFSDMVKKAPEAALPRGMLGRALSAAGRVDEAIDQFRITIEKNPKSLLAYKNLGLELQRTGRIHEAIGVYRSALSIAPADFDFHFSLTSIYEKLGMTDEALEQHRIFVKLRPNSAKVHTDMGIALGRIGEMSEAIRHYEKAVVLAPDYVDAHFNLGSTYANAGSMEKAIEQFKEAVRLRPDNPVYHNTLGVAYGMTGAYKEAVRHFDAAVKLLPSETAYRNNLNRARKMADSQ